MDSTSLSGQPSPADCWIVRNLSRAARPDLSLREGEAARLALQELEELKGSDAHRLCLVPDLHSSEQLQSLFMNLDKYLFRGVLAESVSFRLTSKLATELHGSTSAMGVFGNQIVISLSINLTRHPSRLTALAALVHQMCHAYLLVCCGFGDGGGASGGEEKHDLKHGLAFSSILHTIQDLLVDDARIPLPDLFYCSSRLSRSSPLPRSGPGRPSLHSYCYFDVNDHEDKVACGAYMRHVIAMAETMDSTRTPAQDSLATDSLPAMGTIGSVMRSAQLPLNSYSGPNLFPPALDPSTVPPNIAMPTSGDYQALLNLQTFLAQGDYDPKIASQLLFDVSRPKLSTSTNTMMAGPPRIQLDSADQKTQESNPSNPLYDLRTYMLAQRSTIEPLRRLALSRLYSQRLLKKEINAMTFLEELYTGAPSDADADGYEPDADLRHFAQSFLCARHPDLPTKAPGSIQLEYEDTIFGRRVVRETDNPPEEDKDNTNLAILKDRAEYKDRLSKLRSKGGIFLEDLDKVVAALGDRDGGIKMPEVASIVGLRGGGGGFSPGGVADDMAGGLLGSGVPIYHTQHDHYYHHWQQQRQQQQQQQQQQRALEAAAATAATAFYHHRHHHRHHHHHHPHPPLLLARPPLAQIPTPTVDIDILDDLAEDSFNLERLARLGI